MTNRWWLLAPVSAAALLLAGVSGSTACLSSSPAAPRAKLTSEAGGPADIEVGVSLALTGGLGMFGEGILKATAVAQNEINQIGVLGGRHIVFKIVDDASDDTTVVQGVVSQLLADKVPAILGPLGSAQVLAVEKMIAAANVVEISPSATSVDLTTAQPEMNRFLFRTAPSDDYQSRAIVKFIYDGVTSGEDAGVRTNDAGAGPADGSTKDAAIVVPSGTLGGTCRRMSLVNADDDYGTALGGAVDTLFAMESDASVVSTDTVSTMLATDYKTQAANIVKAQPDCLVLVVYSDVGAQFLRDLEAAIAADASGHDWSSFFVCGSDGEEDSAFIPDGQSDPADPTSANSTAGCYGTAPDTAPLTPQYNTFATIWQESYPGTQPPEYGANQYDAALILALAIEKAGTATDGTAIRDALYAVTSETGTPAPTTVGPGDFLAAISDLQKGIAIKYDGASGPCTFDDYGNVTGGYIIWHVERQPDGTFGFATAARISSADLM